MKLSKHKSQRKFSPINIEILGDKDGYFIEGFRRSKSTPAYYTKVNTEELSIEENLSNSVSDDDGIADKEIWNTLNNKEEFSNSLEDAISDDELDSGRRTNAEKCLVLCRE